MCVPQNRARLELTMSLYVEKKESCLLIPKRDLTTYKFVVKENKVNLMASPFSAYVYRTNIGGTIEDKGLIKFLNYDEDTIAFEDGLFYSCYNLNGIMDYIFRDYVNGTRYRLFKQTLRSCLILKCIVPKGTPCQYCKKNYDIGSRKIVLSEEILSLSDGINESDVRKWLLFNGHSFENTITENDFEKVPCGFKELVDFKGKVVYKDDSPLANLL